MDAGTGRADDVDRMQVAGVDGRARLDAGQPERMREDPPVRLLDAEQVGIDDGVDERPEPGRRPCPLPPSRPNC